MPRRSPPPRPSQSRAWIIVLIILIAIGSGWYFRGQLTKLALKSDFDGADRRPQGCENEDYHRFDNLNQAVLIDLDKRFGAACVSRGTNRQYLTTGKCQQQMTVGDQGSPDAPVICWYMTQTAASSSVNSGPSIKLDCPPNAKVGIPLHCTLKVTK